MAWYYVVRKDADGYQRIEHRKARDAKLHIKHLDEVGIPAWLYVTDRRDTWPWRLRAVTRAALSMEWRGLWGK